MPKPTEESVSSGYPKRALVIEPGFPDDASICFACTGTHGAELIPFLIKELALLQFDILAILLVL